MKIKGVWSLNNESTNFFTENLSFETIRTKWKKLRKKRLSKMKVVVSIKMDFSKSPKRKPNQKYLNTELVFLFKRIFLTYLSPKLCVSVTFS